MATEKQLVSQRERQIKHDDHGDDIYISSLSKGTTGVIAEKLKYFRDHYANDGVLSVGDMRTNVNDGDYQMWQAFISKYGPRLMKDAESKYRLKNAKKTAGIDRAHLMSSIVGIAVAYATLGVNDYYGQSLISEASSAMNFQNKVSRGRGTKVKDVAEDVETMAKEFAEQETQGLSMSERAWLRTDKLADQVNGAIDRAFQQGLDDDYYENHLFNDGASGNSSSVLALFDSANGYLANSLLRDKKAEIVTMVANYVAIANSLKKGYWYTVEDNRVCKPCETLAMESPYRRNAVPARPHHGCRCFIVYY
ncbi:hypothetical protein [Lactiplantibacillus paraxiangfangensis]|uniref:hypothetical protein n=1 Tax=Lactiplantibacillus paraxiangfangensis TaxID=3076224 RepID=UPI0030C6FB7B